MVDHFSSQNALKSTENSKLWQDQTFFVWSLQDAYYQINLLLCHDLAPVTNLV